MKLNFIFRHQERSEEMVEYATAHLHKLEKFEWQPLNAHITFVAERHQVEVEIRLSGQKMSFKASTLADSYTEAFDATVAKLQRQLERKKHQVQDHLVFENTHEGKLGRIEEDDLGETVKDFELPPRKSDSQSS